jgi:MoxR-like ATPase
VRKALHVASALPDYASEIVSLSGESRHPAELPYKFDLAIRNTGRLPWLKGQRFELHSDWRKSDLPRSKSVSHRQATLALQDEVPPGAQVEWQAELRIGMTPGDYQVNFRVLPLDWKIDAGPLIESRTITLLPPVGAIFESPTQKFAGEPIFGEPSRLSWQAPRPPQQLEAQAQALLGIEITNGSGPAWPQGRTLLAVVRWLDPDGKPVDEKTTEISLDAIPAGGNAGSMLNLAAPAQAGEYQLALSLQPQDWAVNVEPPEQTYPILVTAPQVREVSRLTWTPEPPEPVLIAGQTLPLIVQAKNVAGPDWEASTQFQLDLAWRATDRAVFRQQAQSTLEAPLAANEEKPITFQIQSPENRGVYTLQLTLKPLGWECQVSPKSKRWESLQVLSAAILPRGSWQVSRLPASLEAGQTGPIQIAITNRSDKNWEKGRQFELVASWRKGRSRLSSQTLRSDLPFPAPANATVERTVSFDLQMPGEAGDYILSLSLRPVGWEALLEPASQRLSFTVTPSTKPYGLELSMLATTPSLQAGQPYTAQIRLHNISTATWMTGEQFEVQCAFQQPPTEFTNPWGSWSFALEAPVAAKRQTPQQKFTLETNGLPPGDYSLSWQARSLSNPEMAPASLAATLKIEAPPPAPASPPAETSLALPEAYAGDAFAVNYFNNVILPIAQPASQQVDEHMLEVQVMPAPPVQSGQAIPGSPQAQYLVYLTVAEDDSGNSVRNYYRGPLALPGAADTLAELGDFKTGAGLFKSLFHTDQPDNLLRLQRGEKGLPCLLDGYNRAVQRGLADQEDTLRIQLRLPLELPQLHTIRWEYLWDPAGEQGGPLACSERTPFARVLPTASSVDYQPPAISSAAPLRVLVAVSSPGNLADKGLMPITAPEVQAVQDALKLQDAMVRYDMLLDASRETLRKELQAATEAHHPYQALHLLCHGVIREKDGRACLVLNTPGSTLAEEVPDSLLCEILQPFVPGLSLIVLASCLTALPANHEPLQGVGRRLLADAEIPAVVAMQGKLEFTAAQYFSQRLYAQLVAHGEIDRAVNAARRELYAKRWLGPGYSKELTVQANQWGMPVLFTRLVDGRLFTLPEKGVDQTMTQAKPYEQMAGSQTGAVLASAARSAAAALGVQINLSLPSLAQAFGQAVQAAPAVVAPPRLFDQPEQVQSRWRLVWQAAQHRQHPARRAVLFLRGEARRSAERLLREMLDFDGSELDFATRYQALYQTQIWESGPLTYGNQPIPAVLGAGPQPEDNLARDANNQVVHSAAWRAGLRGWDVFSGQDLPDPQKVKIGGNLTWRMEERSQPPFRMPRQTDLQALLSAQDPPASFEALVHPLQGQPVFDEQLASYLLYALNPDIYPFYSTALAKNALQVLDLAGHPRYSQGYAGFCNLALDLLEDDDLGFESLGDVGYFLQRLAASYLPAIPPKPTPGLRVKLEAVNIRSEKVDSELVIQPGVLEQAAAALNAGKHTIMIGPPGTGKTTLAEDLCRFAHDMNFNRGHVLVTATADWTTFDTIGGYMPESGDRLKFRPGIFLEAIAAGKWLVIDEINRADIDKAFGELFTVLSGQAVTLPYKIDGRFVRILPPSSASTGAPGEYHIHPSWRIIGTMNIYDKASLFAMSYAFMRRFAFIDVAVPAPRPYQRLLGNFLERWKLKAAGEEPTQPGLVTARHTLEYLLDASDSANKLMAHRALGPAIALDLIRYLRARSHNGKLPYHHGQLAEAISLYVLPQLDGLEQEHILEVYGYFHSLFKSAAADTEIAPSVEAVKRRIRELFPFIPAIKWKEQEA